MVDVRLPDFTLKPRMLIVYGYVAVTVTTSPGVVQSLAPLAFVEVTVGTRAVWSSPDAAVLTAWTAEAPLSPMNRLTAAFRAPGASRVGQRQVVVEHDPELHDREQQNGEDRQDERELGHCLAVLALQLSRGASLILRGSRRCVRTSPRTAPFRSMSAPTTPSVISASITPYSAIVWPVSSREAGGSVMGGGGVFMVRAELKGWLLGVTGPGIGRGPSAVIG